MSLFPTYNTTGFGFFIKKIADSKKEVQIGIRDNTPENYESDAFKITDIAKCLINYFDKTNKVSLKMVGIRPGEKLHEEMISKEEWMRTEEHKNFLIGNDYVRDEQKSYNSFDSLMDSSEAYNFLKESGVV